MTEQTGDTSKKGPTSIALGDLVPDPRNARRHTERNISTILAAIREDGAARSTVLAGNATVKAAAGIGPQRAA